MGVQSVGVDAEEKRALPGAHAGNSFSGGGDQRLGLPGHAGTCGDAERRRAGVYAAGQSLPLRRALRDAVVLQNKQNGQTPFRRQIEALVDDALPQRAVSQKHDDDPVLSASEEFIRHPRRDRSDPALDAVGVKPVFMEVLTAAASPADALRASHQFGDQAFRVAGPGDEMTVTAVVGNNPILRPEMLRDRDAGVFLPDAGMDRAVEASLRV